MGCALGCCRCGDILRWRAPGAWQDFAVEGEHVIGHPSGRTVEYEGALDGSETALLCYRTAEHWPLQSHTTVGFEPLDADHLVPKVGQYVCGFWPHATAGFAVGLYRGVVSVREQ